MRLKLTLVALGVFILTGCGKASRPALYRPVSTATTGYTGPDGLEYLHNGDPYIIKKRKALAEKLRQNSRPEAPPPPIPPSPTRAAAKTLKDRVREFEISRFAPGQKMPSRFGTDRFEVKVFLKDQPNVAFSGPLRKDGMSSKISAVSGNYKLAGELVDSPEKSVGVLTLTHTEKKESIEISYRAYRAKLTVRRDSDLAVAPGSALERQLKSFCADKVQEVNHCTHSFGWVNNWTVVDGPSFYLVDVVRVVNTGESAPDQNNTIFAFKGESKRTYRLLGNDKQQAYDVEDIPAQSLTPDTASDVRMWANSESEGRRGFELTLKDKDSKETNDVFLDVEAEEPDDVEEIAAEDTPVEYAPPANEDTGGDDEGVGPADEEIVDNTPPAAPSKPAKPAGGGTAPTPPAVVAEHQPSPGVGVAFLATNMSRPRPAKMIRDYSRNRGIRGVQRYIARFQRNDPKLPSVRDFFIYGNPFRPMLKVIANAYDVTPAFAYLTVIESAYARSPKYYAATGDGGLAVGPFQIHPGTARDLGLPVHHRPYFAPSACAAARYVLQHTDRFKGDNTVAILAYNQGGGAAGKFVDRYKRMAGKFSYTYADMERMGGVIDKQKEYVNKYLAVFFIASDMKRYGFDPRLPGAKTRLPANGTVLPKQGISDGTCRAAMNSVRI